MESDFLFFCFVCFFIAMKYLKKLNIYELVWNESIASLHQVLPPAQPHFTTWTPVCLSISSKFIALHCCWYCSFCAYLTILKHALESLSCWKDEVHFKSNFSLNHLQVLGDKMQNSKLHQWLRAGSDTATNSNILIIMLPSWSDFSGRAQC